MITVLIWGTTWYAIKLQVGLAPDEVSIFYRTAFAAISLIIWCRIKGYKLSFKLQDHFFLCLLGLSMFSLHYLFIYQSTGYVLSGVIAVVFSSVSFLSILNNYIFFQVKPTLNIIFGILIGIFGLGLFFWHEVTNVTLQDASLKGIGLAGVGTLIFSLGSSISKRNNQKGLDIIPTMTVGTIYGLGAMVIYMIVKSTALVFPENLVYWLSFLYLVIPGSIIAFMCYLTLVKNIGPELAGYTTVLCPVVALIISSYFEGYQWSMADFFGLFLVVLGNIFVLKKKEDKIA
jgi:drug/metabolite transporter (DMT)-like permease